MRGVAVKGEGGVGFGKVVVRADLYRPVGGVLYHDCMRPPPSVQQVIGAIGDEFAGCHVRALANEFEAVKQ